MKYRSFFAKVSHYFVLALVLGMVFLPAQTHALSSSPCQQLQLPVALVPGGPADQTISAQLCTPNSWSGEHQIDILSPGATYNRTYWDWPQQPELYSYAQKTLQSGRAVLLYDRVGSGQSSHPLSAAITYEGEAYILHQLVQWSRHQGYAAVNTVGHSYGSMLGVAEDASYKDVDRVVLTGLLHTIVTPGFVSAIGSAYPAALDPLFLGKTLDAGYITTEPGTRGGDFYNTATADPAVIAYDETHKDMITSTGLGEAVTATAVPSSLNISRQVTAPVLLIAGQEDGIFCQPQLLALDCSNSEAVRTFEAAYFPNAANLTAVTVPGTGHDLTLHPSATDSFKSIDAWMKAH